METRQSLMSLKRLLALKPILLSYFWTRPDA
jgi:hypothetical protein